MVAAASGKVVYAGSALRGYGNLIIIKHNEDYLSAYAHNDVLRVQEQQEVKAGQRIADMGSSDAQMCGYTLKSVIEVNPSTRYDFFETIRP